VAHSWMDAAARLGFDFVLACPPGYEPDPAITAEAGSRVTITHDVEAAVRGAAVLYTDVWTSMGQEHEAAARRRAFEQFQVKRGLVAAGGTDVLVMHCLPAHRGEEITEAVIDGPRSVIFDQAENRLHVQKAIMVWLSGVAPGGGRAGAACDARDRRTPPRPRRPPGAGPGRTPARRRRRGAARRPGGARDAVHRARTPSGRSLVGPHGVSRWSRRPGRRRRARRGGARDARGAGAVARRRGTPRPPRRRQRRRPPRRPAGALGVRVPSRRARTADAQPRGRRGAVGAGDGAGRSGTTRRLSLRPEALAGRLRRRSRPPRRVGPDVSSARGAVRRRGHAISRRRALMPRHRRPVRGSSAGST